MNGELIINILCFVVIIIDIIITHEIILKETTIN